MIDLYAGSLTKYYSKQWETKGASLARTLGWNMVTVHSTPAPGELAGMFSDQSPQELGDSPWITPEAASEKVADWLDTQDPEIFNPRPDEAFGQYWTEQFPPRVRDAVILWVAHMHRPDLPRPSALTSTLDAYPAYQESDAKGYYLGPIAIVEANLFLPGTSRRVAVQEDVLGRKSLTATTGFLKTVLTEINDICWQADAGQQAAWLGSSDGSLESTAQDGWSRMEQACSFAEANCVALIVDR